MVTTRTRPETSSGAVDQTSSWLAPPRLRLPAEWKTTDEALIELSHLNEPWDFELSAEGELVFVSPEGWDSSAIGTEIIGQVWSWNANEVGGRVFGAQLGVRLPDDSVRSPDVAWISGQRWDTRDRERAFLSVCPELIVEVVSRTDSLREQREKMSEWIENGALLGWLIDPFREVVLIYRPDAEPEQLEKPDTLSGEGVCDGLIVSLERVWR